MTTFFSAGILPAVYSFNMIFRFLVQTNKVEILLWLRTWEISAGVDQGSLHGQPVHQQHLRPRQLSEIVPRRHNRPQLRVIGAESAGMGLPEVRFPVPWPWGTSEISPEWADHGFRVPRAGSGGRWCWSDLDPESQIIQADGEAVQTMRVADPKPKTEEIRCQRILQVRHRGALQIEA